MKIRATVHIAGAGFSLAPGDVTDRFPEAEALRLIAKNAAVLVDHAPAVERAVEVPAVAAELRAELSPLVPEKLGTGKRKGKRG